MKKACEFLLHHQMEDGGWGEDFAVSITGSQMMLGHLMSTRNFTMSPCLVLSTRKDYTLSCAHKNGRLE